MTRRIVLALPVLALAALSSVGQEPKKAEKPAPKKTQTVHLDAKSAGVEFLVQGEYKGDKIGAQVVALGKNQFDVYLLTGGLPGAGWDGKGRVKFPAKLDEGETSATILGTGSGTIQLGQPASMSIETKEGKFSLTRVERQSPTLGAKPPAGARVLFDGTDTGEFNSPKIENGLLTIPANTKNSLKLAKLHIEFMTPFMPSARGQGRGNSGVYIHGKEIQVLDSFGLEGVKNECGAIYSSRAPDVNMCLPPLSWQTYDVEFKVAPDPKTQKMANLAVVYHNGVKIHEDIPFSLSGGIHLQNHGNPVVYRNIWVLEAK